MSILKSFLENFINRSKDPAPPRIISSKNLDAKVEPTKKYERDKADKKSPNLYIGKIIADGAMVVEVVNVHKTNIHVKILEITWARLGTYLDVGKIYPVYKHSGWNDEEIQVWEIAPKHMKRSTSQVIFQWEEDVGWCWDLDF